jgi:hypothetical protein
LGLAVIILRATYTKDKQMLLFSFITDLLWTLSSLAFLVFRALVYFEKHGINPVISFALQLSKKSCKTESVFFARVEKPRL